MADSKTHSAYPLAWPAGWKRTGADLRTSAKFGRQATAAGKSYATKRSLTVAESTARVRDELARMHVADHDLVVSTNIALRLDGWPRSDQREPDDPGSAAYWRDRNGNTRCMAIDRYDRVADNLAAIAATLEAMRAIERHGGAEILNRAFTGFTALEHLAEHWSEVLGLPRSASRAEIDAAYRRLRSTHHPDNNGDPAQFDRIQKAFKESSNG